MAARKAKPVKDESKVDSVLETAKKRFKDSWDYQAANWHDKWDRDNLLYDNERWAANYEGVTDTFVPMVFSTIETMVAEVNNANIRFQFKTGNPMLKYDDAAVNGLIEEWWDQDDWDLLVEEGTRETFVTGMVANFVSWEGDHPHIEQVAMRDAIIDPTIKKPADLQKPGAYGGRRFRVRKDSLDEIEIVDADPNSKTYGQMVPRYSKTPLSPSGGRFGELTDKEIKEMFSGSTLSSASADEDEIIELWDIDRLVSIKNRCHVIEDVVNPHKQRRQFKLQLKYVKKGMSLEEAKMQAETEAKGFVPIFVFRNYRKTSLFYANSEINAIAKEQEYLNDMTNMEGDFLIRQLAPQRELNPKYKDFIDLVNNDPDTVYPFEQGSLTPIQPPVLAPNSFQNRMNVKNEIRETTAIDQVAKGVANVKDATATEVNAQLNQSGKRIQSKARILEKDGFKWWGWILMNLAQLYIDEPLVVEVSGGSRSTAEEAMQKYNLPLPSGAAVFDPEDFAEVEYVKVSLDIDVQNGKLEKQKAATNAYSVVIQDSTNNLAKAKEILYPKMFDLDQDDIDEIITPAAQAAPMAGGMPGDPSLQGAPAGVPVDGAVPPQPAVAPMPPQPVAAGGVA